MIKRPALTLLLSVLLAAALGCGSGGGDTGYGLPGAGYLGGRDSGGAQPGGVDAAGTQGTDTGGIPWLPGVDAGKGQDTHTPQPGTDAGISPDSIPSLPTGDRVDPACTDGKYSEVLPTPQVSIDSAISGYTSQGYMEFIKSVLQARYPVGLHILEGGLGSQGFGGQSCVDMFLSSKQSASDVIRQLSTLVHECGHFFDIGAGGFAGFAYIITPDLSFTCQGGHSTTQGGKTFARSLLNGDDQASRRSPCGGGGAGFGCDSYAAIYLDGDPDDGNFDGGDQGFGSLLEEAVQYVNSLATGYAFHDHYSFSMSERDGILTFLWYVGRYLRLARAEHPQTYALLSQDECWRDAILTVWGRAWLFLQATEGISQLGIDDAALMTLATSPEVLQEIEALRAASGCP